MPQTTDRPSANAASSWVKSGTGPSDHAPLSSGSDLGLGLDAVGDFALDLAVLEAVADFALADGLRRRLAADFAGALASGVAAGAAPGLSDAALD